MTKRRTVSHREHELLSMMAENTKANASHALEMARLRPDQRNPWERIASLMTVLEGQVWDIATQGLMTREDGSFGGKN